MLAFQKGGVHSVHRSTCRSARTPAVRGGQRRPQGPRGAVADLQPGYDAAHYPEGVNVEFVVRRGEHHIALRVHERGSGETRSCGTGACAAMVAAATADGSDRGTPYTVDLPGGTLTIVWTEDDRVLLTGPAVLTAEGVTNL